MAKKVGDSISGGILLLRIFRLSPNYFAFLGGVFISASVNLYTGVYAVDTPPTRWRTILLAAFCALVSGTFWSMIAWNLEGINRLAISESPDFLDKQQIWVSIFSSKQGRLATYVMVACFAAFAGFVAMFL